MDVREPSWKRTRAEKGTQTYASFSASVPDEGSSQAVSSSESSSSSVDSHTGNRDVEKYEPRDYDKHTFLVHWSGPDDKVCLSVVQFNLCA